MPLAAGQHLGPYVIAGPIGTGGIGEVYRARDPRLDREVAIKVLRASIVTDPDWRARFTQEAKAVSSLNHPNIVTVHDVGTEGNVAYMVMELVDGTTLDQLIRSGGLRIADVLRIGAQIADACARAHAAGIVHRDLKPANVIVQPDGRVRVLDFGIAKLASASGASAVSNDATGTSPGTVLGTAAYMSPEQAEGRPVDTRSDIFSLGAILYEMCTGERPFKGDSPVTTMAAVLQHEPPPVAQARPDVPSELGRLVMRCLRKDPARRVQSMPDLKVALEELREDLDSGRLTAVNVPARRGRFSRSVVIAAGVLLAVGLIGVASWWGRSVSSSSEEAIVPVPLTTFAGSEADPSLSPDGTQVAFRWDGEDQKNFDIYVMLIGGGSPLRLTTDPHPDYDPQWSPDGRRIAFLRALDRDHVAVMLVPPLGGPERTVIELYTNSTLGGGPMSTLCWTPDSRYLIVSGTRERGQSNRIIRVTVDTGETLDLAVPSGSSRGYASPAISPDGRTLAIAHYESDRGVELLALSDATEPRGFKPFPAVPNVGRLQWTPDGRDLMFSYFLTTPLPLFRMPAAGGEPRALSWMGPGAGGTISFHGRRMVFSRSARDTNILRLDLKSLANGGTPSLDRIAQSSFREVSPQYSPDGTRLAFYSNRSGSVQIWTANADGTQPVQLTSMDPFATTGTPRWSPDGGQISFDSNFGGFYQIYVVPSGGGRPRALTSGSANSYGAVWSRDGWIYFASARTGTDEIWRMKSDGASLEQVTRVGASSPGLSPDGRWLFFTKRDGADGLWRIPIGGGQQEKLLDRLYRYDYAVIDGGVYYVEPNAAATGGSIAYLDLATGATRRLLAFDKPPDLGLAVSRDGRYLLFTEIEYSGQDLMMVDNFR